MTTTPVTAFTDVRRADVIIVGAGPGIPPAAYHWRKPA